MVAAGTYPLEVARAERRRELEKAEQRLSLALTAIADARSDLVALERERVKHREATGRVEGRSTDPALGRRAAAELDQTSRYLGMRRSEEARLDDLITRKANALPGLARAVREARQVLSKAASKKVPIDTHHRRWMETERRRSMAREE
jgi:hypothetical protein